MKLKIIRTIKEEAIIDIEFPFYYKHDLMLDEADVVIYGKIEENKTTSIHVSHDYNGRNSFELEIENDPASHFSSYMTDEYKSNEDEYLKAKSKLIDAVNNA